MLDEEPLSDISQARDLIDFYTPGTGKNYNRWGMVLKVDGSLIGTCGYFRWNQQHQRAEIGYDLCPDVWGQGLMPEALQALIRYGFAEMNLNRIEAMTHIENLRSQHVLTKLGFQREGLLREYYCQEGIYNDQVQYSLLKREWKDKLPQSAYSSP
jgi:ribosomal-protein-alanine N-acetyltransferase